MISLTLLIDAIVSPEKKAMALWNSKPRRTGCVNATAWFVKQVPGYKELRLEKYTKGVTYINTW